MRLRSGSRVSAATSVLAVVVPVRSPEPRAALWSTARP
jgi:hypothetical protein